MAGWSRALRATLECELRLGAEAPRISGLTHGQLERLQLPPRLIDMIRRARHWWFGTEHFAGGEEWPMFGRDHEITTLNRIAEALCCLDLTAKTNAGEQASAVAANHRLKCDVAQ